MGLVQIRGLYSVHSGWALGWGWLLDLQGDPSGLVFRAVSVTAGSTPQEGELLVALGSPALPCLLPESRPKAGSRLGFPPQASSQPLAQGHAADLRVTQDSAEPQGWRPRLGLS